ncbi:MAG: UMP kinase [Candidatus Cloacimonetes bacterium]|jgi:uridylate kinase|nr:UMP kinase [Candidatus Cloacimonadota bacterium]MDD4155927.1 UMP kinase [Candidatus Cloacimonadota bacterium]
MAEYQPEKLHRLILKISGEFLAGDKGFGFDQAILHQLSDDIIELKRLGYSIGIVLGGGNFFRGKELSEINRAAADNVGMLATIQNAIVVAEYLKQKNYSTEVYSAFPVEKIAKFYTYKRADISLKEGKICFFCGGTGNPFFTTDTAAILRAIELDCDIVLKGTKVDGIYTADPKKDKNAVFIPEISYSEALNQQLNIMDMTAFSLARDYKIPIKVFDITVKGNLKEAVLSRNIGTYVYE